VAKTDPLTVQFNPAPAYLFDYLTADIQTAECIFDLIDNSIDAARSAMIGKPSKGLPNQYKGFKVELTLTSNEVVVADNCSGISEADFTQLAFRSGVKSQHTYGIGHFGVGMKRAILKLGKRCTVETDDGKSKLTLTFTRDQLDQSADLTLPATKAPSDGSSFTRIQVNDIGADTKRDLDALRWNETLIENMGRRYGLFIRKGLVIEVNGTAIVAFAPQPIANAFIPLQAEILVSHGVEVDIIAGVHEQYRFSKTAKGNIGADPANLGVHKQIAREFGWYIVCNDRVILLHDQSYKTGWMKNWHNEYNGFVGWVQFRSEDPSLLPWNTRKSDILENSEVYADILGKLQAMAQKYRQTTPLAKARRGAGIASVPLDASGKSISKPAATAKSILAGSASKAQLKSIETLLPANIAFASQLPKLAGMVHDCERLVINNYPYACAVMLRVVFEAALRDFIKRQKRFIQMRDAILDGKLKPDHEPPTPKERKNYSPSLGDMIAWCINNSDVFPDPNARACKQACQRFSHHLPVLNGIVHEETGISNPGQIRTIRDEVLQGLLHILGS
jgi:hypothetical protein